MYVIVEQTFGVQTQSIPVDFNEGRPVFEKIQKEIEGKEIGILGKRNFNTVIPVICSQFMIVLLYHYH